MKYLKMFSKMNNTNGGQMVFGKEQPFVDFESIRNHSLIMGVYGIKCNYLGISIISKTEDNRYYAAPPLDYLELDKEINYLECMKSNSGISKEADQKLKLQKEKFNTYIKNAESFIPFMIKAFKLADDGTILQIVVKNNEWELEEIE